MSQDSFDRFDDMAERTIWPWIDDESHEADGRATNYSDYHYDYHDDFYGSEDDTTDESWDDDYDDSMDGDHESGLASAGWGTDEDYGFYGDYGDDY
jgi:hypothetical protein